MSKDSKYEEIPFSYIFFQLVSNTQYKHVILPMMSYSLTQSPEHIKLSPTTVQACKGPQKRSHIFNVDCQATGVRLYAPYHEVANIRMRISTQLT